MKKVLLALLAIIILGSALVTTQTVSADTQTSNDPAQATTPVVGTGQNERTLSDDEKLLVGMIQLNGTAQAITQTQATSLLPIFQQYLNLVQSNMPNQNTSNTQAQSTPTAPAATPVANTELETRLAALITQVKTILTTDQINAISALTITQDNAMQLLQSYGLQTDPGKNANGPDQGNQPGQSAQGQAPAGAPLQGNGPQGNSQAGNGQLPTTPDGVGKMNGVNPRMVVALITYIQKVSNGIVVTTATPAS
jgi:hypothetical protein